MYKKNSNINILFYNNDDKYINVISLQINKITFLWRETNDHRLAYCKKDGDESFFLIYVSFIK